jgi:hypothetical protein
MTKSNRIISVPGEVIEPLLTPVSPICAEPLIAEEVWKPSMQAKDYWHVC